MIGASLSEVWGEDFKPQKKVKRKKFKNKPLSPDEMDSGLLIRQSEKPSFQNERERLSLLRDDREEDYTYERINPNVVTPGNPYGFGRENVRERKREIIRPSRIEDDPDYQEFLEYKRNKNSFKKQVNRTIKIDENDQFNELLLYVFTGFFLLILYDNIYKLGKKSY